MRRALERRIARPGAFAQAFHRRDELVEAGLAFGFRRLDQHGAMDHQREIDRHRVIALVDQPLARSSVESLRQSHHR
jgi:hypothetical protein